MCVQATTKYTAKVCLDSLGGECDPSIAAEAVHAAFEKRFLSVPTVVYTHVTAALADGNHVRAGVFFDDGRTEDEQRRVHTYVILEGGSQQLACVEAIFTLEHLRKVGPGAPLPPPFALVTLYDRAPVRKPILCFHYSPAPLSIFLTLGAGSMQVHQLPQGARAPGLHGHRAERDCGRGAGRAQGSHPGNQPEPLYACDQPLVQAPPHP